MRRTFRISSRDQRTVAAADFAGREAFECTAGIATTYPDRRRGGRRRPPVGRFVGPPDADGRVEVEVPEPSPEVVSYPGVFRFGVAAGQTLRPGDAVYAADDGTVRAAGPPHLTVGRVAAFGPDGAGYVDVTTPGAYPAPPISFSGSTRRLQGRRADLMVIDALIEPRASATEVTLRLGPNATAADAAEAVNRAAGAIVASVDTPVRGHTFSISGATFAQRLGQTAGTYTASGSMTLSPEAARGMDALFAPAIARAREAMEGIFVEFRNDMTATKQPLTEANLRNVVEAMIGFGRGEARLHPDTLIVPPQLHEDVLRAVAEEVPLDAAGRQPVEVAGVEVEPEAERWLPALLPFVGKTVSAEELAGVAEAVRDHGLLLREWNKPNVGRILRIEPARELIDEDADDE